jgi:argininosuccinate lyase
MKSRSARSQSQSPSDEFLSFTTSVPFDRRLWRHDIAGSIAHAHALHGASILTRPELNKVVSELRKIASDLGQGKIALEPRFEDVHMNIESILTSRLGDLGAKIHTGRSRNDQVALDMRLYVRENLIEVMGLTCAMQRALLDKAEGSHGSIMPGYTHLQHAQPLLLSHHLLAHTWRLQRDFSRLEGCYDRTNVSPLGAGALAGNTYGIHGDVAADLLCMCGTSDNSLDAVSDRDFVAESAFALSMIMIHLSSLCEELVLWSSQEFGFVKLPQNLSSGSSMMPQKRNPDIPELVRGKTGRTVGDLIAILTVLKSLPLAYNRDLQEDKESLFDVFDTVEASLRALTVFLASVEFDTVRMGISAEVGLMTATDLADFLAKKGVPFRKAHSIVRDIACRSGGDSQEFVRLASEELDGKTDNLAWLTPEGSVRRRNSHGGTAPLQVTNQLKKARMTISRNEQSLTKRKAQAEAVDRLLS